MTGVRSAVPGAPAPRVAYRRCVLTRLRPVLDDPAFQRAFLAVSHLLGGAGRSAASAELDLAARELSSQLESADRATRATALARELERIARALDERRLA